MSRITTAYGILRENGIYRLIQVLKQYTVNRTYLRWIDEPMLNMQTPAGKIEFEVSPEWGRLYEIGTGGVYEPLLLNALYEILSEDSVF